MKKMMGLLWILLLSVLLTACGGKEFIRQEFNAEAAHNIKAISVTQFDEQKEFLVWILNHPAMNFGILGAGIAASDLTNKTKKLTAAIDPEKTNLRARFYEDLSKGLSANQFVVTPMLSKATDKIDAVRKAQVAVTGQDARMLVTLEGQYLSAGANTDYFPAVASLVELTDAKTNKIIYTENYQYGFNSARKNVAYISADKACQFKDFDSLIANPDVSRKCLQDGAALIAAKIISDLKK